MKDNDIDIPDVSDDEINYKNDGERLLSELEKTFNQTEFDLYDPDDFDELNNETFSYDEAEERMKITRDTAQEFLKNAKSDRRWKNIYAFVLLAMLVTQVIWLNDIFLKVGKEFLHYEESTFNIYITASLIEVIAIVKLVVKHLFHDNISASFKNVFDKIESKKDVTKRKK